MKNFRVQIRYHGYYADFNVSADDTAEGIEKSILDKIGEKSIKWEYMGNMYNPHTKRITYEEVIDDTRPIQYKEVLGVRVATGAPEGGQV